jgi:hypothetical protein
MDTIWFAAADADARPWRIKGRRAAAIISTPPQCG